MATITKPFVGARCVTHHQKGVIRYVGTTAFAPGKWIGVELDEEDGKNDGSVGGKQYFECKPNHGVFVRASQIRTIITSDTPSSSQPPSSEVIPGPRFAPANDPNMNDPRGRLRSPTMVSNTTLPTRINTSGGSIKSSNMKPPGSPTSIRTSFTHSKTPSTPTFPKQTPMNLDVVSVDVKRMDSDAGYVTLDNMEDDSEPFEEIQYDEPMDISETPHRPLETSTLPDPFSLQDSTSREQFIPFKDYDELRMKLKIMENKRQEDREKIREAEMKKQEADQFLSVKPKLQAKMADMQQELRDLKKQLKDAQGEKELYENKYNEAVESMEMMTLDKEMAEAKADNLQHEVNLLKEKIEEISVDLNVFKQEGDLLNHAEGNGDGRSAVEIIQLERQNERLKEALVRLRDVTSEQESELNRKIKSLEKELSSLQDIQVQHDQLKNHMKVAESQIDDLKTRLDDVLNADDMLEQLTEKNLAMGDKLEEMRMTIEDLEALKELNDELEESHIENEKQLQTEIDHKDSLIREYLKRIESADETNADYENTISQFRELVANLQSDLDQTRQKEESQYSESKNLSSQSQTMLDLTFKLQSTVMKAQAKQIDLELRKLDAIQASDNLAYVQPYLPDSFFSTENDSIRCLLLLKRLVFKSELIIKQLDQIHDIPEKLKTTVPEELIAVCEMRQKLAWFSDLAKRLVSFVSACPVETFLKMGQVYHDLIGTERRLNLIVELLRKEELKEASWLLDLQRSIAQLEHLAEIYLTATDIDDAEKYYAFVRAIYLNGDTICVTLGHIKQAVAIACKDEEIKISGADQFNVEFFQPLQSLVSQSKSTKSMARKLLRRLDELCEQSLALKADFLHQFHSCFTISSILVDFCLKTWKAISAYINDKKDTKEELLLSGLQQLIYRVTEQILNINEVNMWEGCTKSLQGLCQEIGTLDNITNDSERSETAKKGESPWVIRSKNIKAEVVVNQETERKLQQSAEEIRELMKELKMKDQALQEGQVKIELLEKRIEHAKGQADTILALQEQLASSRKQQNDYEEAMESLQTELETLEQDNKQFKKLAENLEDQRISPHSSKRNTLAKDEAEDYDNIIPIPDNNSIENQRLNGQIEALKFAVRFLRAENSHLKGRDALNVLNLHLQPQKIKALNDNEMLKSVALEAKSLLKDFRAVSASPRIVDLTKTTTNHKGWQPKSKMPNYHYQAQQSVMYTLQLRSNELKTKLTQIDKNNKLKDLKLHSAAGKPPFIGRIQVPLPDNSHHSDRPNVKTSFRHSIKLKTASDFEKIHTIFVN
ncbi:hypothetical protein G9A89_004791 [Geosiphon pyriformis]|nr:hypothetical protein G9A89_004791 [Geosiphon pyriformis]